MSAGPIQISKYKPVYRNPIEIKHKGFHTVTVYKIRFTVAEIIFFILYIGIIIDGQVCSIHLVHLQTDNFRLFFCKKTDKEQTSVCMMSKRLNRSRKIARASIFCFLFETAVYMCISKTEITQNGIFCFMLQAEKKP